MKVGDKVKFDGEVQRYTVQACDQRFAIMTKPFNARKTYLYTITDFEQRRRGPCNLIFGPNHELNTPEGAAAALQELRSGEMEISRRNTVGLSDRELAQLEAT